ncbi:MAG: hypothetical protein N2V77_05405 [Canidatus Methanoxibalbensis ujae]|nr:hypothetical protein [Candidatus Methanoxibalbensis ujae]
MMLLLIPSFSKEGYSRGGGRERFLSRNILKINETDLTDKCELTGLTRRKRELLDREYDKVLA